jgi:hypothetical protein
MPGDGRSIDRDPGDKYVVDRKSIMESKSPTGDPEGENESEGAGGGSEEVREILVKVF